MRRILTAFTMTAICIGAMMPLHAADPEDCGWLGFGDGNLYARYFVDPSYKAASQQQPDSGESTSGGAQGTAKQKGSSGSMERARTVFNLNILFGGSGAFFQMKRTVALNFDYGYPDVNIETRKMIGLVPGAGLNCIFNVARYFGFGFGSEAGYFHLATRSKKMSYRDLNLDSYLIRMIYKIHAPNPAYYLEVPAYGMLRFYFSESFRAVFLDLGGGVDFFLLGHPAARSYIARAGLGFTLENGFTMEFCYQYNTRLIEKSNLTNMLDMNRVMLWMGYCVNADGRGRS